MDLKNSIEVRGLCKSFTIRNTTIYGGISKSGRKTVLNNVDFDLKKGEVLGIIGKNGSGKSTLLKIITNIMGPDAGSVEVNGKMASILELGMGFDPESSGRDNVRIKCGLYGLTNKEVESCISDIIIFSELGEQIDHPLRTYSSGMKAKLAFSVLMHVKCDVLIIDEVLSVGDASFNSKCKMAFQRMKKSGCSIIVASHNISTIENMCDRVLWMEGGGVKEIGDPIEICYHYTMEMTDSISTVVKMAESGDLLSMNRAGEMYRDGITVEKDLIKAEEYFIKASKLGCVEAQVNLANMKIASGDIIEAENLLKLASQRGNQTAIIALMQLHDDSGEKEDLINTVRQLAEDGNSKAIKLLADMLFQGNFIQRNVEEAIIWYTKSAEFFNSQSEFQLGICYRDGLGVQKNPQKAIEYLTRSSEHGYSRARTELANMYRKGMGVDRDMQECIKWYEISANAGDSSSMYQLGLIYRDGTGVSIDEVKSNMWMKLYSDQIISNYELNLGDLLKQGYSGNKKKDCLKWYTCSADRGNINGMVNLANVYRDGGFITPDPHLSFKYYSEAANRMNSGANYELAMIYLKGISVERDLEEAGRLLKIASLMGNQRAMMQYVCFLQDNDLEKTDFMKIMLRILSDSDNQSARNELQRILDKQL